jgi:hypothetical protein
VLGIAVRYRPSGFDRFQDRDDPCSLNLLFRIEAPSRHSRPETSSFQMACKEGLREDNVSVKIELALITLNEFGWNITSATSSTARTGVNWASSEVKKFSVHSERHYQNHKLGLSTLGFIPWYKPQLMKAAEPFVDFFAPTSLMPWKNCRD